MNNAQKHLEKPLQCNMCYSVFSNKTEQLEITLKRKGNEQKGARNEQDVDTFPRMNAQKQCNKTNYVA